VGPRFAARAARLVELNPGLPAEQELAMQRMLALLPEAGSTLVSIRQNLPEGILLRSKWNSSLKSDLVMANPGLLVGTGLVAAMAIPAFQKVRATSQQKAVLNNLRQLAAARDQYFLETGKDACTYEDLVGPDKYIRRLNSVDGEDYSELVFRQGEGLRVTLKSGRTVEYRE
jgi:type IV pilus assembly protein PilA